MKKIFILLSILLTIILILSGCVSDDINQNDENQEKEETEIIVQNTLPIPVITIRYDYPLWWNDILYVSAEGSSDSDGEITNYIWWFDIDHSTSTKNNYQAESKTGSAVSFQMPNFTYSPDTGNITLSVTDDDGASSFSYDEVQLAYRPYIYFEQVGSSTTFEITSIAYIYDLVGEEINAQFYRYTTESGWSKGWVEQTGQFPGYKDIDQDGIVTNGDTFTIDDRYIGDTIRIELIGGEGHNSDTIIGSLEATIE